MDAEVAAAPRPGTSNPRRLIGGQPFDKPGSKIAFEKRHIQMMEVFLSPEILKQPSENEQPARWLGKHAAVNEHFKAVINEPGADEFFKVFMERTDGKLGVPARVPSENPTESDRPRLQNPRDRGRGGAAVVADVRPPHGRVASATASRPRRGRAARRSKARKKSRNGSAPRRRRIPLYSMARA